MKTESLTQERFDLLIKWLDPDRDRAGAKYEEIRLRLIKIFACRGWAEAEDLADETITRVASKVSELGNYSGDPARYFYGVANKIHLEYARRRSSEAMPIDAEPILSASRERELTCVERCLERLSTSNREMILKYYQQEKRSSVASRKVLAKELGIQANTLRIRAHRIRAAFQKCVHACLEKEAA